MRRRWGVYKEEIRRRWEGNEEDMRRDEGEIIM